MSHVVSAVLLLFSVFWFEAADAQRVAAHSPSWSLSISDGRLTADVDHIPLRVVLGELARQIPLRVFISDASREYPVTAQLRGVPLNEALVRLLTGLSYVIVHDSTAPGSAATTQMVELLVIEKDPRATIVGAREISAVSGQQSAQASTQDTPPEWTAVLQHPDREVRLEALQRWATQGAATPLNPLTEALVDPDESVRARAQELVERVLSAN